jgi:hypothetical protein
MIAEDHESVLVSTDAHVLIEHQVDARHTRVVCALAEERNRLTASPRLHGTSQAFVPDPEGTLGFGKVLVPRVQSKLRIPRTVGHKRRARARHLSPRRGRRRTQDTDAPAEQPAVRRTLDISIEGDSYEQARENLQEWIGSMLQTSVGRLRELVIIEEIHGFEGDHEPVRDSDRGIPLYPAKARIAALTGSVLWADEAFTKLIGSVTFEIGGPELYFDALDSTPPERGTIVPPDSYYLRKARYSPAARARRLWAKLTRGGRTPS